MHLPGADTMVPVCGDGVGLQGPRLPRCAHVTSHGVSGLRNPRPYPFELLLNPEKPFPGGKVD